MGASGQYQLSVLLKTVDQMSGGLSKGVSNLKKFGVAGKSALRDYEQFRRAIGKPLPTSGFDKYMTKMRAVTKETRGFGVEQGRLSKRFSQPIKTAGLDSQIGKLREYRRELRGVSADSGRARAAMRGGMPSGGRPLFQPPGPLGPPRGGRARRAYGWRDRLSDAGDFSMNVRQAGAAWRDRMDSLDKYIAPVKDLLGAKTRFQMMGWSPSDVSKGMAGAEQVSRSTRGISQIDAQEALNSLVNTIGGVDEALRFLPLAAKYQANMKVMYGGQFSQADITRQIGNTFKALELLGVDKPTGKDAQGREVFTSADQQRMERYFNIIAQATTATGGEVNPTEFKNFAKYSRMAGSDLSPEGMMKLLPLIQQMGGSSTGTAMMTLYRNMIGGVIPSYKLRNWDAMGLLDRSKVEFSGKTDKLKRLLPGAIPIAEGLGRDPMAVADKLAAKFKEFGIDTTDSDAVNKQLMSMFGDRTGVGALAQLINYRSSFAKETRNYERTPDIEKANQALQQSQLMQFEDYEKAVLELKLAIGQNLLPVATQFMGVMKPVSEFFRDHPTVAKYAMTLMLVSKAGSGVLETWSIFNRMGSGVDNFFRRTVYGADAAAGAMSRAERQALGLGNTMRGIPTSLKIGLVLGAAWFTLQQILELYNASGLATQAEKRLQDETESYGKTIRNMEDFYAKRGEKVPQDELVRAAKATFGGLNEDNRLKNYLAPESESLYHKFFAQGTNPFRDSGSNDEAHALRNKLLLDPSFTNKVWKMPGDYGVNLDREIGIETSAAHLRKQGQALGESPGTMLEFRKMLSAGDYAQEAKNTFNEALRRAFPTSYEQSQGLAQQLASVDSASRNLLGLFDRVTATVRPPVVSEQFTKLGIAGINPSSQLAQILLGVEQPATQTADALSKIGPPADKLPGSFDRVGGAAERLGARLDGVRIPGVIPTDDGAPGGQTTPSGQTTSKSYKHLTPFALNIPGLARGGPARKGRSYFVGERGTELFSPQEDGFITPHHALMKRKQPSRDAGLFYSPDLMRPWKTTPTLPFTAATRDVPALKNPHEQVLRMMGSPPARDMAASHSGSLPAALSRKSQGEDYAAPDYGLFGQSSDIRNALTQDALSSVISDSSKSENHFHIDLHVTGDVKDAERLSSGIAEKLAAKVAEIERTVKDSDRLERMVVRIVQRGRERA
jgi:hypothetical protein